MKKALSTLVKPTKKKVKQFKPSYSMKGGELKYIDYAWLPQIIIGAAPYNTQYNHAVIFPTVASYNQSISIGNQQGNGYQGTFFGIASGVNDNQREGRMVNVKSILMNFTLSGVAWLGPNAGEVIRLCLIQDSQFNGTVPTINEVYGTTLGGNFSTNYTDLPNVENSNRFKILCDESIEVTNSFITGENANEAAIVNIPWKKYLKVDIPVTFTNTANNGSTGSIAGNNVFLIARSRNGSGYVEGKVRIRYTDK